jgi:hypothetical protein
MKDYALIDNTTGAFPNVEAQNATGPGTTDGTPIIKEVVDDLWGARQALMIEAGLTPNGVTEASGASQFLDALDAVIAARLKTFRQTEETSVEIVRPSDAFFEPDEWEQFWSASEGLVLLGGSSGYKIVFPIDTTAITVINAAQILVSKDAARTGDNRMSIGLYYTNPGGSIPATPVLVGSLVWDNGSAGYEVMTITPALTLSKGDSNQYMWIVKSGAASGASDNIHWLMHSVDKVLCGARQNTPT